MTIDKDDLLNSIIESLDRIQYIKLEDIPNIDLYMDQVTTFMDKKLKSATRNPEDDKILTKTMINNYAKNDLLPPPEKKKYSKEHILLLIFIYYYKGILTISDIQTLLNPLSERFFGNEEFGLSNVYKEVFSLEKEQVDVLKEDVISKFHVSKDTFEDAPEESREFLQLFSFICMLSFDVYVKKLLIEKMVDSFGKAADGKKKDAKREKPEPEQNKKN
ncbi:DUF1836 domain-containing protein [Kineothrix sedimenti]|uniref:DUF1836 domain-containing protein n=1 Tax=Kineothrix sedimenti TaxID=3123317 RepID=A0ABZ3F0D9_9FIRM